MVMSPYFACLYYVNMSLFLLVGFFLDTISVNIPVMSCLISHNNDV